MTFAGLAGFMEFMRLAGGLIAILVAVMGVPAYRRSRRDGGSLMLGRWGGTGMQAAMIAAYVLMALGNLVTVG